MRLWDDRLWYAKVGLLAAAVLVACRYSNEYGHEANPALAWILRDPARFDGRETWMPSAVLERSGGGEDWLRVGGDRIRAVGIPPEVPAGHVTLRARVRAQGPLLDVKELRPRRRQTVPFLARYAVSAVVLAGWFALLVLPAFRWTRGSPALLEARR